MSFTEKLNKMKIKLVVIVSIVIFCLAFGGIVMAKYVDSSKVKDGISLGNKYLEEQKYEEAIIAFQKVIEIEPKNIEARVGLSKAYVNTGRNDESEDVLKEAININPKKVEPYLELSKLYISKNDLINSIKILTDGYKATNDESIKSMLEDIKSKITIDDINITVTVGEDYSLPKEVTLKIDNNEVQFPVNWDTTEVDTTKVGTTTFNGTLENTDKTFKLTLNVIAITSIEDINNKIKQNDKYSLPSKVTATMTDNSKRDVEVTWDPSSVDTSKAGNYSYQGTVNGYNSKVALNLTVNSIEIYDKAYAAKSLEVKSSPGTSYTTLGTIEDSTEVEVYGGVPIGQDQGDWPSYKQYGWSKIKYKNGYGWVKEGDLSFADPYAWAPGIKEEFENNIVKQGYAHTKGSIEYKKAVAGDMRQGFYEVYTDASGSEKYVVIVNVKTGWYHG